MIDKIRITLKLMEDFGNYQLMVQLLKMLEVRIALQSLDGVILEKVVKLRWITSNNELNMRLYLGIRDDMIYECIAYRSKVTHS